MYVSYELYDKEGEPLMRLEGKEYIAPIGSAVAFYDAVSEEGEFVSVEFIGKATHQWYNITSDTLCIDCEVIQDLTEYQDAELSKYHELKFKKSC
jgi:hypothetical protein